MSFREFNRKVNFLDIKDKKKICKIIMFLGYELKQNPNGAYIKFSEISEKDFNIIYSEINKLLNKNENTFGRTS